MVILVQTIPLLANPRQRHRQRERERDRRSRRRCRYNLKVIIVTVGIALMGLVHFVVYPWMDHPNQDATIVLLFFNGENSGSLASSGVGAAGGAFVGSRGTDYGTRYSASSSSSSSSSSSNAPTSSAIVPPAPRLPQKHKLGRFRQESAWPYLSHDVWYEKVDNNRTFLARRHGIDDVDWVAWMDDLSWPVVIVMSDNSDDMWPPPPPSRPSSYQPMFNASILDHPMLARIYVQNPRIIHPKIIPLPIGPKWQSTSMVLYGESKQVIWNQLHNVATSPNETRYRFLHRQPQQRRRRRQSPQYHQKQQHGWDDTIAMDGNKEDDNDYDNDVVDTVWVRPMRVSHRTTFERTSPALRTNRDQLCRLLQSSAPKSTWCGNDGDGGNNPPALLAKGVLGDGRISRDEYFVSLTKHRFVASPVGRGLDSHATWEALLAGCIPIVPHSTLDPMFVDLPVWLINDWATDVTDATVAEKAKEMVARVDEYNWDKVYATGWVNAILRDAG